MSTSRAAILAVPIACMAFAAPTALRAATSRLPLGSAPTGKTVAEP
jgi:hypothetical protein